MPGVELDKIYCGDSRTMRHVDDNSVQLIVTSPPYNVGTDYSAHYDEMALEEYLGYLQSVWQECIRVLVPGGRLAVNIANTGRKPYIPLNSHIATQLIDLGLLMRGEIVWDKGPSAGTSTAWGSFARASNPTLRDVHEYILVFCKATWKLEQTHGKESGIENLEFVEWTKSVWRNPQEEIADAQNSIWQFDTHSIRRNRHAPPHPAMFPLDLPLRLVLLYTNVGDIVLDPFIGSGTTGLAAKMTQRHYIGYDITPEYCAMAEERIAKLGNSRILEERIARKSARKKT